MKFRYAGKVFGFPTAKSLRTDHLDDHYNTQLAKNYNILRHHADIFGLAMFGDGATVKRMPVTNLLAAGAYCPAALLQIIGATAHLKKGGKKDAKYIAKSPHCCLGQDYC